MPKILVITYGSIDHASSRTRIIQYFDAFKSAQFSILFIPQRPKVSAGLLFFIYRFFYKKINAFRKTYHLCFTNLDGVFISRVFISKFDLLMLNKRKIPFVFDFDDAIYLSSPKNENRLVEIIQAAKNVIISTPNLNQFCNQYGVEAQVIPTSVDTTIFYPNQEEGISKTITIGWIGSPSTEKYLYTLQPVLKKITSSNKEVEFLTVGTSENFFLEGVRLRKEKWSKDTEAAFVRQMDIGIMPLADDIWSRNKGGYKLYLYFSTGIPCVATPVGTNQTIIDSGKNGFLASTLEEWENYLVQLIDDRELRKTFGKHGLEKCKENYSKTACERVLLKIVKEL